MLSSKASCNSHGQDSSYFSGWQAYEENPYHKTLNPNGVIQMGLAENQLSLELMEKWLAKKPEVLGLTRKGKSVLRELALFQDYHGLPSFKTALCNYMGKMRDNKVKFDPDKLVLTAGATSGNETLTFCLADPGQAILVPTPYYPAFDRDLKWRTGVEIIPIHCSSSNGFRITMSALEDAYMRSQKIKLKVRAVLVTNPSNPLGTTLTREELNHLIDFAVAKRIHLVSDEVYSATVFDSPCFVSLMEAAADRNIQDDDVWSRIHVVSSLSKDLGLPGFRVGMIYSNNGAVVSAATKMSSFGLVSAQTQFLLSEMLGDEMFTLKYTRENLRRLKKRRETTASGLRNAGIECLESNAGLFCWADMRHLLSGNSFEGENELWKRILNDVGLNISPGGPCHCQEPGWFRICFANMDKDTLKVAMRRMEVFVDQKTRGDYKQKLAFGFLKKPKWVLKLSSNEAVQQR